MALSTIISFCTGYEGIGLGLEIAGLPFRIICYVEGEAYSVANLVAKIKEGKLDDAPIWDNIKYFDPKPFIGLVDGIIAGYPCQPFSCAGKRGGETDPRHLWPYIRKAVGIIRPRWCFFENVEGHISMGLSTVVSDLEEMGYKVSWGIFSASEVGAPHRRKRVFILAHNGMWRFCEQNICNQFSGRTKAIRTSKNRIGTSVGLANPPGGQRSEQKTGDGREVPGGGGEKALANSEKTKCKQSGRTRFWWKRFTDGCCWPAHPGESQYKWEEPRVIMDNTMSRRQRTQKKQVQSRGNGIKQSSKRQAQSCVGGTVNGASQRVDRLRLLGNGVVPQQVARAWQVLCEEINIDPKNP